MKLKDKVATFKSKVDASRDISTQHIMDSIELKRFQEQYKLLKWLQGTCSRKQYLPFIVNIKLDSKFFKPLTWQIPTEVEFNTKQELTDFLLEILEMGEE